MTRQLHAYYLEVATGLIIYVIDFDGYYHGFDDKGDKRCIEAKKFEADGEYLPWTKS